MRWAVIGVAVVCSCSLLTNLDDLGDGGSDVADVEVADSGTDATPARCSRDASFGAATLVGELHEVGGAEIAARLTGDELDVFYTKLPTDGGFASTYTAHRDAATGTFGPPVPLNIPVSADQTYPSVDREGLVLYLESPISAGNYGIFTASRQFRTVGFQNLQLVSSIDTPLFEGHAYITPDNGRIFFDHATTSSGPFTVMSASNTNGSFSDAAPVPGITNARTPVISADGLALYYASDSADGAANLDIWRVSRAAPDGMFGSAVVVQELATASDELPTWISEDECVIYFQRSVQGAQRILTAQRSQ